MPVQVGSELKFTKTQTTQELLTFSISKIDLFQSCTFRKKMIQFPVIFLPE